MIDSVLMPGVIYHMISMTVSHEGHDKAPRKKERQLLRCMELCGGRAAVEDVFDKCWKGEDPTIRPFL